ncbi:MAG: tetratricopeptide repeat protein, partial [Phycisphaerales bacterium]
KINVKVLVILLVVVVAIGASLFVARHARRRILSRMDLNAGQAAYDNEDWPTAAKHFQAYLGRNPDDLEILKKYAESQMHKRPLDSRAIGGAVAAYRRIIRVDPNDEAMYEQLAKIYTYTGQFQELIYIAGTVEDQNLPDDRKSPLWKATALFRLDRMDDPNIAALEEFIEQLDPAKHPQEYVQACTLRSEIILSDSSDDTTLARQGRAKEVLGFLGKAVNGVPESAEALVTRARFYRASSDIPDMRVEDRMAAARADLIAADELGTEDPRVRSALCAEWIAQGELDKADAELKAAGDLSREVMDEHFFDVNDWTATKFILASEIAMQKGDAAKAASLADEVRAVLTARRHIVLVLPTAVISYVAAGDPSDANDCLDEYIDATRGEGLKTQDRLRLAYLRALVARAQDRPYAVIDILQPILVDDVSDSDLWRLLAEAYERTNQPSRAVGALTRYLRLRPQDSRSRLQLAGEHLKLRDWDGVLEHARLVESLDPNNISIRLLRIEASANIAAGQGETGVTRLKELSSELTGLRQKHPELVDIRILQAIIALYLEQPDKDKAEAQAERELKLAIEECEEPLKAEMQLVGHYYRLKRMTEAISTCKAACENHSEVAEPWLALADLHVANVDPNSARSYLEQGLNAVAEEGEKRALTIRLALLEMTEGERTRGIDLLTELAAKAKQDVRVRSLLLSVREVLEDRATAQQFVDELKEAEGQGGVLWRFHQASLRLLSDDWRSRQHDIADAFQYCIDADPKWSAPVLRLGGMYERLNDSRRAEDTYRRALARNPAAIEVVNALMVLLQQQGRIRHAEELLDLLKGNPEAASAWNLRLALGSGDLSRAIEELEIRVSNDQQDANSRIILARLVFSQYKDVQRAFEHLKEAEAIEPNSMALVTAKVDILKGDGQAEEARRVLDDYVARGDIFGAYMLRAAYLAGEGQLDDAEKDYQKLTTLPGQGAVVWGLLSDFYVAKKDLDLAVEALETGLKLHTADLNLKLALMNILFRRSRDKDRQRALCDEDHQRALDILGELEERLPQDIELMMIRANLMIEEATPQSIEDATAKLKSVIKLEPTAVDAHLMLIGVAMQQGEYETAGDLAIQAVGSNPDNPALLSALLNTALRSKEQSLLEEARMRIESALTRNPADEKLLISRARVMGALKRPQMAIPELEAYCETNEGSRSVDAIVTLADLYRLTGDMAQAKQRIEQAEQIDPDSQTVIHARFIWLVAQKRYEELEEISSVYISTKEQNVTTVLRAALVLAALDSVELKKEAVKLFEHAASLSPTLPDARLGLASTLYQIGDADRSKKIYQQLLAQYANKYPENIQIFNDLAWILQEQDGDYTNALDLADRGLNASRNDNDKPYLLDTRGTIFFKMERFADAKTDFETLVGLSAPDSPRKAKALLQLGRTCSKLKELDQVKEHLNEALEIDQKLGVFTPEERLEIERLMN